MKIAAGRRSVGALLGAGLSLVAVPEASAKQSCAVSTRAAIKKYIKASEEDWAKSVATNDPSVIRRILAEDLVWVLDGRVLDKPTAVREAAAGPNGFLSNATDYVHVRFFGNTAVAQGRETWTKTGGVTGRFIWTDVWVARGGCWQIVNAQDSVVPLAPD